MKWTRNSFRRHFRFRLRTLLLLPVVFAAGWWWIAYWPERTATRFVELLTAGNIEAARAMSDSPESIDSVWKLATAGQMAFERPTLDSANWKERLTGERRFSIPWKTASASGKLAGFVASRGQVILQIEAGPGVFRVYSMNNTNVEYVVAILKGAYGSQSGYFFAPVVPTRSVLTRIPAPLDTHIQALISALDARPRYTHFSMLPPSQQEMDAILQKLKETWQANGEIPTRIEPPRDVAQ